MSATVDMPGGRKRTWTREAVIDQLQDAAFVLDRTPTVDQARERVALPSGGRIAELFGSYREAVIAAGLTPLPTQRVNRRRMWTPERVLTALQEWAAEQGSPPTLRQAMKAGSPINASTVSAYFGTWNGGLEAAGLPTRPSGRERRATREPGWAHHAAGSRARVRVAGTGVLR